MTDSKSFINCDHHGYDKDPENGLLMEEELLCYSLDLMKEDKFPVKILCAFGGRASQLPNRSYCQSCQYFDENLDCESQYEDVGFSPRKKLL